MYPAIFTVISSTASPYLPRAIGLLRRLFNARSSTRHTAAAFSKKIGLPSGFAAVRRPDFFVFRANYNAAFACALQNSSTPKKAGAEGFEPILPVQRSQRARPLSNTGTKAHSFPAGPSKRQDHRAEKRSTFQLSAGRSTSAFPPSGWTGARLHGMTVSGCSSVLTARTSS